MSASPAATQARIETLERPRRSLRIGPKRLLGALWPSVLTAALLAVAILRHARIHGFYRITDFIQIGQAFANPFHLRQLADSITGYDGQYYYFIARFPGQVPHGAFTWPALYYARIVYPLLARLLSFGNADVIPWMMLGINVAAIVGTVALFTRLTLRLALPRWLALVPGLYCGQALAMFLDLADPLFVFWLVVALVGVAERRWLLAGAALGLGMLTREATLAFVLCFAVPLVVERRWRILFAYAALALVPYALWQVVLRIALGVSGVGQSSLVNALVPIPFAGLASAHSLRTAIVLFVLTCSPALAAIGLGLWRLVGRPRDALVLAVALGGVAYGCLILVQPGVHWLDIYEPMRLAAPLAVLIPLLVKGETRVRVATATSWLMIASFALALFA